ncbi:TetR/AcrR family transcriptional regulator [Nocardioides mesophilus]|uniref:TetR/AcrR family transcriptional regulator n=1 Tax=Nocardioides mesophilus TaxID=433659 RepID=A0A7G9R7E2_9ACTN|nr:TetR/AcrR family transcriptional regulator [Nocardioides mesophilus]QNN51517.1 TetR/AcrR family transcriptional regulator [Nocardioides mesophilus]
MVTAPTRSPRRAAPLSAEDRRKAIVDAVVPLLIEHGESVSTRQIARAAGIAEGTIFRVFPDKSALLMAAAEETLNPSDGREGLAAAVAGLDDLHEVVRVVTEQMFVRSEQVMAVLMALRTMMATAARADHDHGRAGSHGPPGFVVEAHRALLERLTEVFEPFRDQLTVPPERAALLLRTLVLGSRHPGMQAEDRLSADEVAEVLLHGIRREGGR